jgi:hypothetical protein
MTLDDLIPAVRERIPDVTVQLHKEMMDDEHPSVIFIYCERTISLGPNVHMSEELVELVVRELLPL